MQNKNKKKKKKIGTTHGNEEIVKEQIKRNTEISHFEMTSINNS